MNIALTLTGTNLGDRVLFSADISKSAPAWSDVLLVIDDPAPTAQLSCSDPDGVCPVEGNATGANVYTGVNKSDETVVLSPFKKGLS